jgi:hypothetical protein
VCYKSINHDEPRKENSGTLGKETMAKPKKKSAKAARRDRLGDPVNNEAVKADIKRYLMPPKRKGTA